MTTTLTDGDRLIISLLLTEGDASPEDIDDYLLVLAEGLRLGEADSIRHVEAFRAKASQRSEELALIVELDRLEAVLPRLADASGVIREVANMRSTNGVHDFIAIQKITSSVERLTGKKGKAA